MPPYIPSLTSHPPHDACLRLIMVQKYAVPSVMVNSWYQGETVGTVLSVRQWGRFFLSHFDIMDRQKEPSLLSQISHWVTAPGESARELSR